MALCERQISDDPGRNKRKHSLVRFVSQYGDTCTMLVGQSRTGAVLQVVCGNFCATRRELQVLGLKANNGFSREESARILGISPNTVKNVLDRVRKRNSLGRDGFLPLTTVVIRAERFGLLHPEFLEWMETGFK